MPTGFLFISLNFTPSDILLLALAGLAILLANMAAIVFPLGVLAALLRRQWKWALMLSVFAVPAMIWSFGGLVRDSWDFRRAVAQAEALQVTQATPDLTGKVVALLVNDRIQPHHILECTKLLAYSGAAKIYLLRGEAPYRGDAGAPDLRGPVDLTHWIRGEAVPSAEYPRSARGPAECALGPTEGGLQDIDYFIARDLPLYGKDAPQGFAPAELVQNYGARLDEYFAPVADPHNFRMVPEIADLVRIPLSATGEGFPRMLSDHVMSWPATDREREDYAGPVKAALCRQGLDDCSWY